jgi:hypothetical protein
MCKKDWEQGSRIRGANWNKVLRVGLSDRAKFEQVLNKVSELAFWHIKKRQNTYASSKYLRWHILGMAMRLLWVEQRQGIRERIVKKWVRARLPGALHVITRPITSVVSKTCWCFSLFNSLNLIEISSSVEMTHIDIQNPFLAKESEYLFQLKLFQNSDVQIILTNVIKISSFLSSHPYFQGPGKSTGRILAL